MCFFTYTTRLNFLGLCILKKIQYKCVNENFAFINAHFSYNSISSVISIGWNKKSFTFCIVISWFQKSCTSWNTFSCFGVKESSVSVISISLNKKLLIFYQILTSDGNPDLFSILYFLLCGKIVLSLLFILHL